MLSSDGMPVDRRALLRSAILLVGGTLAGVPQELLAQAAKPKRFFTPAQFATLAETADIILPRTNTPGAKDAGVPEALDGMMTNWASEERKRQFRELIDDIEIGRAHV